MDPRPKDIVEQSPGERKAKDREIRRLNCEIAQLSYERKKLLEKVELLGALEENTAADVDEGSSEAPTSEAPTSDKWPLTSDEYQRYGRQMILPAVGNEGQLRLKNSSVLIVGLGGLGCPAAAYLAGAGLGTIGLVDGDTVETSNLHRQTLHSTNTVGQLKVASAATSLRALNSSIRVITYAQHLSSSNAASIASEYDAILDCTDHPTSRYLISDTAVLLGKPLVSASALKTDGQLMVLNNPAKPPGVSTGGPCYRCIFPKPPPPASVTSCSDGGILGPVVGVMGVLQALEAIKLITVPATLEPGPLTLLLFSALSSHPFRSVTLRPRRPDCALCSSNATISLDTIKNDTFSYLQFCGVPPPSNILESSERISAVDYEKTRDDDHILIDVRDPTQFGICHLPNSINIPISTITTPTSSPSRSEDPKSILRSLPREAPIHVVCRLGHDSQLAVRQFQEMGLAGEGEQKRYIGDISGGLRAWREEVDPDWPDY